MGCIVAGKEFIDENKEAVDIFLKEYSESIDYVNNNVSGGSGACREIRNNGFFGRSC